MANVEEVRDIEGIFAEILSNATRSIGDPRMIHIDGRIKVENNVTPYPVLEDGYVTIYDPLIIDETMLPPQEEVDDFVFGKNGIGMKYYYQTQLSNESDQEDS